MSHEYFSPNSFNELQNSSTRHISLSQDTRALSSSGGKSEGGFIATQSRPNLALGHNGNPPPTHTSNSYLTASKDKDGTVTEFYGPRPQNSLNPPLNTPSATRNSANPSQTNPLHWTLNPPPLHPRPITTPYPTASRSPLYPQPPSLSFFATERQQAEKLNLPPSYPYPTTVTPLSSLSGPQQRLIDCPSCRARCLTRLEYENGEATMKRCQKMLLFCFVGSLLPLMLGWRQDLVHYCMNCGERVAVQRYDVKAKRVGQAEVLDPEEKRKAERKEIQEKKGVGASGVGELPVEAPRRVAELEGRSRADAEVAGGEAGKELPGGGWTGSRY